MGVLTHRKTWRKASSVARQNETALTGREAENVRSALVHLRGRLGSWEAVGRALGVTARSIQMQRHVRMKSGIAVRVAKALGVSLGHLLCGWHRRVARPSGARRTRGRYPTNGM